MSVLHLPQRTQQHTTIGDDGWYMVQLTADRAIADETGPMGQESAYLLAAEAANARDGHLYGIRQAGSDVVMAVDAGDESYLDDAAYPYLDEQAPAVAA